MADLRVELLAVEACPHLDRARRDLQAVLREGIVEVPIQTVLVGSIDDAEFLGFQGSPTIRVNGQDVVPQPELPVGLGCRLYRDEDGATTGSPPIERIRAVIDAHRRGRLQAFQRQEAGLVADFAREAAAAEDAADASVGRAATEGAAERASDLAPRSPAEPEQAGE